jgi:predicted nucleotidyltransferase component of viral defense system
MSLPLVARSCYVPDAFVIWTFGGDNGAALSPGSAPFLVSGKPVMPISLEEIRRRTLIALFSDDQLMNELVLKGGNALALIYDSTSRATVDMDFSIAADFPDLKKTHERIFATLKREFQSVGYVVFDERFGPRPAVRTLDQPKWWGGYIAEFKLAERNLYEKTGHDIDALRRQCQLVGPQQKRTFKIDISQNEFCEAKVQREIDDYTVYVYSLEMIAVEKFRAICQQMPEYILGSHTARARDFYDIHRIVTKNNIDLTAESNLSLMRSIFAAKEVPLALLSEIRKHRDFHAPDWPAVEASITGEHDTFDSYFDFVVELARKISEGLADSTAATPSSTRAV